MNTDLSEAIEQLVQAAPRPWLEVVCAKLQSGAADTTAENMLERLPPTHNGDLAYRLREVARLSAETISWEALSSAIALCSSLYDRWQVEQRVELLWAGPAPADGIVARRIDQVLYDLIATAQRTFCLSHLLLTRSIGSRKF
jgi:cardiolipin synthase A/B